MSAAAKSPVSSPAGWERKYSKRKVWARCAEKLQSSSFLGKYFSHMNPIEQLRAFENRPKKDHLGTLSPFEKHAERTRGKGYWVV